MPIRLPTKLKATAIASAAASVRGNVMAASGGHGRFSRPENFTIAPASHRLNTLVTVASTAAAGGMAATRKSTSLLALGTPGVVSGTAAGTSVSTRRICAVSYTHLRAHETDSY